MFFNKKFRRLYRKRITVFKYKLEKKFKNKIKRILTHDIKTPVLAQIRGLEILRDEKLGSLNFEQKELIEDILNSHKFLYKTLLNTIYLLGTTGEKTELKLENINLSDEIKSVLEDIKEYSTCNIRLKIPKNTSILADRELIQKIIFNLIQGSIFSSKDNPDIEIGVKNTKESVMFYAKNKTTFMTKEKINSLFEDKKGVCDFNQLGANLNLNIAQKLIDAHKWNLVAKSNKDNTSTLGFLVKR